MNLDMRFIHIFQPEDVFHVVLGRFLSIHGKNGISSLAGQLCACQVRGKLRHLPGVLSERKEWMKTSPWP